WLERFVYTEDVGGSSPSSPTPMVWQSETTPEITGLSLSVVSSVPPDSRGGLLRNLFRFCVVIREAFNR
ncbi:hypothetical protein N9D23_10210, partial [Rubripirellula sp.]|nr:hypothetical protein [Rubripirellula sp.]